MGQLPPYLQSCIQKWNGPHGCPSVEGSAGRSMGWDSNRLFHLLLTYLVGGFNPFEDISQIGCFFSPNRGENKNI